MRLTCFAVFAVLAGMAFPSYAQVTSNVLLRTLEIRTPSGIGTAFTIDVDYRQYLITAKHVVETLRDGTESTIQVLRKGGWSQLKVTVFKCVNPVDIAVLVPPGQVTVSFPLDATSKGMVDGQDAYFVGFPYGASTTYDNQPGVFPLVKRATVAQFIHLPAGQLIELDGYNNPGFSGSPLVYRDVNGPAFNYKVAGVIVSFFPSASPVLKKIQELQRAQITPEDEKNHDVVRDTDGRWYRVKKTDELVMLNTGIAQAWDIGAAVNLIRQHPIGPRVSSTFTDEDAARQFPVEKP